MIEGVMMRNSKICLILLSLFVACVISACGGSGSNSPGQTVGTTVSLQSSVKTGTTMSVFTGYTSLANSTAWGPQMSFELKSTVNQNAGAMASDITITEGVVTYEYVPSGSIPTTAGTNLVIPPLTKYSLINVPAGGSASWDNVDIFSPVQKQYLLANSPLANSSQLLQYRVRVTFNGREIKNGNTISASATGNIYITQ